MISMTRVVVGFLVFLPLTADAQRVEVSLFGGSYMPVRSTYRSGNYDVCDEPCPSYFRTMTFGSGPMIGGRLTFEIGPRYGVDVTLQGTSVTNQLTSSAGTGSEDVRLLLLSIQPHYQMPLNQSVEAVLGAGLTILSGKAGTRGLPGNETMSGWRNGLAFTGAIRGSVAGSLRMELNGTLHSYVNAGSENPMAFVWGIGLTYAPPSGRSQ